MVLIMLGLSLVATSVALGALVIGASIYDVRLAKLERAYRKNPNARVFRRRPLFTILITTHNDAMSIEHCLESVIHSRYRKYQIIVVDCASSDTTRQQVRRFAAQRTRRPIRVVSRPQSQSTTAALQAVLRQHAYGQLVMVLPATTTLHPLALTKLARHFAQQTAVERIVPYEYPLVRDAGQAIRAIAGLPGQYAQKLRHVAARPNKLQPVTYASTAAAFLRDDQPLVAIYAADVITYQTNTRHPAMTISRALTQSLLLTVLMYGLYVAVDLHQPELLLISWLGLIIGFWLLIWGDGTLSRQRRLLLTLTAPVMYLPLIAHSLQPLRQLKHALAYWPQRA